MTHWSDLNEFYLRSTDGKFLEALTLWPKWVDTAAEAEAMSLRDARAAANRGWTAPYDSEIYPGEVPVLTITPDDAQRVLDDDKVLTVRYGLRDYGLENALLHDRKNGIVIPITILRTSHCLLENVPLMDLALTGNENHEQHLEELRAFYPKMELYDPVTIVRFKRR